MSPDGETMDQRRARLSGEIARQRGEFGQAYLNLHKPIELGESGLRAFGFVRQNTWIFVAIPAALKVITFGLGLRGIVMVPKAKPSQRQSSERAPSRGILGTAVKLGGHGVRLFKTYRRIRKFFP